MQNNQNHTFQSIELHRIHKHRKIDKFQKKLAIGKEKNSTKIEIGNLSLAKSEN